MKTCHPGGDDCILRRGISRQTRPQADGPKTILFKSSSVEEGDVFQTPNKNKGDNVWLFYEVKAASGTGDPTRLATLKVGSSSHYFQGF